MDVITNQQELNIIINEYLHHCGFRKTLEIFNDELNEKSIQMSDGKNNLGSNNKDYMEQLIVCFNDGNHKEFFKMWNENMQTKNEDNTNVIELTFSLHVYFAIYPIKTNTKDQGAMERFKHFLSINGPSVSHSKDFVSLCALPYMANLKQQPAYKYLFTDKWSDNLKQNLMDFLRNYFGSSENQPKLLELYRHYHNFNNNNNASNSQLSSIMKDYNVIIQTTADLIELLESAAQGNPITQNQVEQITKRLFNEQTLISTDLTRPGTAAQTLRQSVAVPMHNHSENRKVKIQKRQLLDYDKIKHDLAVGDEKKKQLLFQGLRLKLMNSAKEEKVKTLQEFLSHDILECLKSRSKPITGMLNGENELIKQSFIRLLSAIASFYDGRSYIAKKESMIEILIKSFQSGNINELTKRELLCCLNKLSSRGNIQLLMIEKDMILWLVNEIESNFESPYVIEYGMSLLTNLCLRTAGKNKCSPMPTKILELLSSLLQSDCSPNVMTCVIGTFYSILAVNSIKEEALSMGILNVLNEARNSFDETMNKHVEFVIQRLTSPQDDDFDSNKEDDDEDDGNDLEDLDRDTSSPGPGEINCESVMNSQYSLQDATRKMSLYNNTHQPITSTPDQVSSSRQKIK